MAIMLSKTYDALISAGAPEDKAREAAEELADYESRLASIDNRLAAVEGKLTVDDMGDRHQCGGHDRDIGRAAAPRLKLRDRRRDQSGDVAVYDLRQGLDRRRVSRSADNGGG